MKKIPVPTYVYIFASIFGILLLYGLIIQIWKSRNPLTDSSHMTQSQQVDLGLGLAASANTTSNTNTSQPPTPLAAGCALAFSFTPSSKVINSDGSITYSATLVNQGRKTCTNASFSVYYDANESVVSTNPRATSAGYYWQIGNLGSGKTYTSTIVTHTSITPGSTNQISNEACATADNGKDTCVDNVIFTANSAAGPQVSSLQAQSDLSAHEFGTWIWESPVQESLDYFRTAFTEAKKQGVNTVYITIDDYLNAQDKTAYMKAVNAVVKEGQKNSLAIVLEGGARDWSEPANQSKGLALIDFVGAYNTTYPNAPVHGFQYDVEPYLLPAYTTDPATVLTNFVSFIDKSVARFSSMGLGKNVVFSVVIPHFYDSAQGWTPQITYNGSTAFTYTHLLKILEQRPGSEIIIMAYRNFWDDTNGIHQISQQEISEAVGFSTKIIIAQETGDITPAYVTYHGLNRSDLFHNLDLITKAYTPYSSFGGVAVHYLDPFLQLP